MNALTLKGIVEEELGYLHIDLTGNCSRKGKLRTTRWSRKLPGFGVRIYGSGRKVYVVQALMQGRTRTVTIGNAKILNQRQAMDVARRVLVRAQIGQNPAEERIAKRKIPLFADYLKFYWKTMMPKWKPSTQMTQTNYRQAYLDKAFAGKFLDEIEEADVVTWFNDVTNRGGPGAGNRCFEILRAMFNKAEEWGHLKEGSNPCAFVRANKRRKCERFLSDQEFARLGMALDKHGKDYPLQATIIYLLILTGCRKSEIVNLLWSEVKGRRLSLTDSKTGPRTVWLGEEARILLAALPRHRNHPEVFWNPKTRKPVKSIGKFWEKVKQDASLSNVRLHDLRHSFASHAAARSETLPMIGQLLGHSHVTTTARYAHLDDGQVIEASQRIGDLLEEAIGKRTNRILYVKSEQ
ncbi:tyrosine-type recombinase/integrase [Parasphingorhabdus halotolerans]|uniref:Site-specific integrase n=1 Tax=Parasphingorhabdus halotolerans TaxID=2725558 RepID=A0A6H2DRB4_9SPHN|nr:tyrosine-type recombinase/integrase [Parasphingorhabdus halotolerans]QJB70301.1 site-specific integrase [Parasphingorhabdus halotolerans]